jgi:hypothetical protein
MAPLKDFAEAPGVLQKVAANKPPVRLSTEPKVKPLASASSKPMQQFFFATHVSLP